MRYLARKDSKTYLKGPALFPFYYNIENDGLLRYMPLKETRSHSNVITFRYQNQAPDVDVFPSPLDKLNLFHSVEIFWKYCKKMLESNFHSFVQTHSIKIFFVVWNQNIEGTLWKYSGNKIVEEVQVLQCSRY